MIWQRGETWWKICRHSEVFFFACLFAFCFAFVCLFVFFAVILFSHKTWWECKCQWVCYRGRVYRIVDVFRYRRFQRTPFRKKKNAPLTHVKTTETSVKHKFLFLSHLQREKGFIKGETLGLLWTKPIKERLLWRKRDIKSRLTVTAADKSLLTKLKFSLRNNALEYKPRHPKTFYCWAPSTAQVCRALKWSLSRTRLSSPATRTLHAFFFSNASIVAHRRD